MRQRGEAARVYRMNRGALYDGYMRYRNESEGLTRAVDNAIRQVVSQEDEIERLKARIADLEQQVSALLEGR